MIDVKSTIDGKIYNVRNLPDKQLAADYLALLRQNTIKVVNYLKTEYASDPRIKLLSQNFNPDVINESRDEDNITSYSVNKGEKIFLCIRQKDNENSFVDKNTQLFVIFHELAHLATKSIGHTQEFWDNMKFLLEAIINSPLKIYEYQPYHKLPQEYCGTVITSTPYKI